MTTPINSNQKTDQTRFGVDNTKPVHDFARARRIALISIITAIAVGTIVGLGVLFLSMTFFPFLGVSLSGLFALLIGTGLATGAYFATKALLNRIMKTAADSGVRPKPNDPLKDFPELQSMLQQVNTVEEDLEKGFDCFKSALSQKHQMIHDAIVDYLDANKYSDQPINPVGLLTVNQEVKQNTEIDCTQYIECSKLLLEAVKSQIRLTPIKQEKKKFIEDILSDQNMKAWEKLPIILEKQKQETIIFIAQKKLKCLDAQEIEFLDSMLEISLENLESGYKFFGNIVSNITQIISTYTAGTQNA